MIKVSLGYDEKDLLLIRDNLYPDRKNVLLGPGGYASPNDDIHEWICEFNLNYQIGYEYTADHSANWYFEFDNNEVALLFKLTWC
jgi:hypothetical protein